MKNKADLVLGWLRKAHSDLRAMEACNAADSRDAACFHAQQAAEKSLKAFLVHANQTPPPTHNLARLVKECSTFDPDFRQLEDTAELLTPFAVEARYDSEFWPTLEEFSSAEHAAREIVEFISRRVS